MDNFFGNILKIIRERNNVTQNELCHDLCTIRQLSRIENNVSSPSLFLLQHFSERLGTDLLLYVPYATEAKGFEIKNILERAQHDYEMREFHKVQSELTALTKIQYNSPNLALQVHWLFLSSKMHLNIRDVCIDDFLNLLARFHDFNALDELIKENLTTIEYNIIASIIFILLNNADYDRAERHLNDMIGALEKRNNINERALLLKSLYNLSRLHFLKARYDVSMTLSKRGIEYCYTYNHLEYLDMLKNIYGRSLYKRGYCIRGQSELLQYIQLSMLRNSNHKLDSVYHELIHTYKLDSFSILDLLKTADVRFL
ncbi:helix-turn-helix transcriptional regulator [Fusibacter paucivorans]|uniref:Helix-turn-helix transcriptional regulator n=1 Tax=Fusibacter paucivorans TaxID=76009 RepID=A0ABS5PJS7_9FIRM|nr:helix-turn-helix transcriptional regulator [Fusibacter paucivorans]MBS7525328.1 helix-turn-helix transcriptional regulator [Fusibacter paucivorans]